ncbi:ribosome biogenesis GTPase Der [Phycisphaera mikurensis]|uniref:ribosome biogenesis GTPase Der n=1 Tax=Phycisphaera mikurensis TaxID=547188 RepID=UPI000A00B2D0|nr:ribosome biogenesis GTPase Der [Phycisphaera mikurensis]MBB6442148.1 GTP-binding protein [Phycisphaera mikurensis]
MQPAPPPNRDENDDTTDFPLPVGADPIRFAIVGRPNVGKSSLMNMLAGRRVSIVDPTAGVTRDRLSTGAQIPLEDGSGGMLSLEIVDTGGYGIVDRDDLAGEVERQIAEGLGECDAVLFVIDAVDGVTPLDERAAKVLRESGAGSGGGKPGQPNRSAKPVVVVANKMDAPTQATEGWEAMKLGFGEPVFVSATTRHNRHELEARLREAAKEARKQRTDAGMGPRDPLGSGLKLALVGKRNAGKSTLLNALAGQQRVIVSEKAGTTRDSIDVEVTMKAVDPAEPPVAFTAIDTAGVRKTKSLGDSIEFYSQHRSLRSVRRADVVLLLLDATVPVSQVDQILSQEVQKHYKPCVIVVNKWDLIGRDKEGNRVMDQEAYVTYLEDALRGLDFAPIVFISAKNGTGLRDVVALAHNLHEQSSHRVGTGELNRFFEAVYQRRGPGTNRAGKQPRLFYATMPATNPPTLALFVNDPELFDHNYQRYLMNNIREELPFSEVPIKLLIRGKTKMSAEERLAAKLDER